MLKSIANTGIRTRLLGGFALICILLAATVIYTVMAVSDISSRIKIVANQRAPVAIASTDLVGNLYSTLATLRGYLLTGDAQGKRDATVRRSGPSSIAPWPRSTAWPKDFPARRTRPIGLRRRR